jgi:hypothetical protein
MNDNRATLAEAATLHGQLVKALTEAIKPEPVVVVDKKTGEAEVVGHKFNAASLAVAVKFLKDQGVTCVPERSADVKKLLESLPFGQDELEELANE